MFVTIGLSSPAFAALVLSNDVGRQKVNCQRNSVVLLPPSVQEFTHTRGFTTHCRLGLE